MSEKQKQVEKERKGVLELLLQKNGLTRKELVDFLLGVWVAGKVNELTEQEKKQFPNLAFWSMTKQALSFNPNHIFVDTNVLVGAYSGDNRYMVDIACIHYLFSLTGKKLYISALSVAQLISVFQKKKTNKEITQIVRDLQHRFNIISFTEQDIEKALIETGADIEDNVQFVLAKKQKCYIVVTNNYKDYRFLQGIVVLRPAKVRKIPQ